MNLQLKSRIIENYGKQWVFAKQLGVHDSVVSKVVTGAKRLPNDEKRLWATKLNCNVSDIFPNQEKENEQ